MLDDWSKVLVLDTETHLIKDYDKVRTDAEPPLLVALGWSWLQPSMSVHIVPHGEDPEQFLTALQRADYVVFHNAAFDVGVLVHWWPKLYGAFLQKLRERRILDTHVLYRLLDPEVNIRPTLQNLCRRYCDWNLEKGDVRTSFRQGVPLTASQEEYLRQDVRATGLLAHKLLCQLDYAGPGGDAALERPVYQQAFVREVKAGNREVDTLAVARRYSTAAAWLAMRMGPKGLCVDADNLQAAVKENTRIINEMAQVLQTHGLASFVKAPGSIPVDITNPADHCFIRPSETHARRWTPAANYDFLYRYTGAGRHQKTEGRWKTAQKQLRLEFMKVAIEHDIGNLPTTSSSGQLSLKYDFWKQYRYLLPPGLQAYLDYAKAAKIQSAFLNPLLASGATRVFPVYHIPGCETFRWSCSSPNVQQLPKKLRNIYRAYSHVFVGADYKSLELYTLAQCAKNLGFEGNLMATLRRGGDLHTSTAALMFDKPPEAVDRDTERQTAKIANFSLSGGMGVRTFMSQARAAGLDWDMDRAAEVADLWFRAYPEIREYLNTFKVHPMAFCPKGMSPWDFVRRLGFNPDKKWPSVWEMRGRMNDGKWFWCELPSGRVVPNRRFTQAANCLFQGTGADVITEAFCRALEWDLDVRAVVHDSILVSCVESDADLTGRQLLVSMKEALAVVCPDVPVPDLEFEVSTHLF